MKTLALVLALAIAAPLAAHGIARPQQRSRLLRPPPTSKTKTTCSPRIKLGRAAMSTRR